MLVSELMLQQTQVSRVVPRYEAFLRRFPTAAVCAAAAPGEVVRAWEGLGYNRRALNLHRAAVAVVERHGGRLPGDIDALLALPGVGPYTARAVLAFAFERDVGVVDVNAVRVLARAVAARPLRPREAQALADERVPAGRGWEWNQAVLDLGAMHCRARRDCERCPVRAACGWARAGWPSPDPAAASPGAARRQGTFEGSDRQGRGRLIAALRHAPVQRHAVAATAGWPDDPERAARVVAELVTEGLVAVDGERLVLPGA